MNNNYTTTTTTITTTDKNLETQLDILSTEKWDLIEKNKSLEEKTTTLTLKINQLSTQLDGAKSTIDRLNTYIQGEEWKNHRTVKAAEDEAKRIDGNYEHAKSIVAQLTKTLEDHLARKTITLYNENQKLSTQIAELNSKLELSKLESSKKDNISSDTTKELEQYKSFYTNIGHEIFRIISCNPIKKPFKIYNLYNNLCNFFHFSIK